MRIMLLAGLALATLAARPAAGDARPAAALLLEEMAPVPAMQDGNVRVWLDGNRDLLYPRDRIRVRARTTDGAYLAVFHIDTNGDLDVLFPRSEWDDGWVDGGRTLSLSTRGGYDHLRVNGGPGVGYVFAVALDEPLELWRLRDLYRPRHAGWDASRTVFGDPFYAMDEIVRAIVPEWAAGYESIDRYTYHVGRRYTHPRYACYDGYGDWYYSRVSYWPSCDRVRIILVNRPYYYDTYRWHGDRRYYYRRHYTTVVRRNRPLHGYKEQTEAYAPPSRTVQSRPQPRGVTGSTAPSGGAGGARVARPAPAGGSAATPSQRGSGDRPGSDARPGAESGRRTPGARVRQPATRGAERPGSEPSQRGSYERPERDEPPPRPAEGGRRPSGDEGTRAAPPRESSPAHREPAPESSPRQRESTPRARPSDGGSRAAPPSRPRPDEASSSSFTAMYAQEQDQERRRQEGRQQDRPVESSRERPTFQRRGSSGTTRAAQPRRESPPPQREAQPRRESPPPEQREAPPPRQRESSPPPARDAGGGSTRPSASPGLRPGG